MGEVTGIEWTDHTFNPWIGCQKVSSGCDNCYAEALVTRYGWTEWGPAGVRRRTSEANWRKPLAWNRAAARDGVRRRVFCASLADVFDNKAPAGAREDLWKLIEATPHLDWQLLSKRPQLFHKLLPLEWYQRGFPRNLWLGVSAENQAAYDQRWPLLASVPARTRFISYEPALGSLTIMGWTSFPDWIIWGGESGRGARTMDPQWARDLTAECLELGVSVFGKQWGTYQSNPLVQEQGLSLAEAASRDPKKNGKGGAVLDGRLHRQFPLPVISHQVGLF